MLLSVPALSTMSFAQDKPAPSATQEPKKAAAQDKADASSGTKEKPGANANAKNTAKAKPAAKKAEDAAGQPPRELHGIAALQQKAVESNQADWAHWGPDPEKYSSWKTHSNRLIPLYTFGDTLDRVRGANSVYRNADKIQKLYGFAPSDTLNEKAEYFDQTDVYRLQKTAAEAGTKRIILFVFDGTDWQTTWAAAIAKTGRVPYTEGRGTGLSFQDYRGVTTDYGYFVTSPHNEGTTIDVDAQRVVGVGGKIPVDTTSSELVSFRGANFPMQSIPSQRAMNRYTLTPILHHLPLR